MYLDWISMHVLFIYLNPSHLQRFIPITNCILPCQVRVGGRLCRCSVSWPWTKGRCKCRWRFAGPELSPLATMEGRIMLDEEPFRHYFYYVSSHSGYCYSGTIRPRTRRRSSWRSRRDIRGDLCSHQDCDGTMCAGYRESTLVFVLAMTDRSNWGWCH